MNTPFAEPLFAIGATAIALFAVLLVRAGMDRRSAADRQRLFGSDDDSGLSLPALNLDAKVGPLGRLDRWFDQAVGRTGLEASPAGAVAAMGLCAVLIGAALFYWKGTVGFAAFGIVFGLAIPLAVIAYLQSRYRRQLQNQLPDTYHMLAGSLRGGQTLEQAIDFAGQQGPMPLAGEMQKAAAQLRLGVNAEAALRSAAGRIRLLDFDILVSTVGLHRQTGGNLAMLMDRLATSVRDRNHFRGQFLAATAQGRAVAIAIGLAGPLLLLGYALFEPDHVQTFFNSPTGWSILAGCLAMQVVGMIWLWQILKIEY